MPANEDLLEEARSFCDASTGEVLERIPNDLMNRLRVAKLARGIPGLKSQNTKTLARWFVFFSEQIRDRVALACREANGKRRRARKAKSNTTEQGPAGNDKPRTDKPHTTSDARRSSK